MARPMTRMPIEVVEAVFKRDMDRLAVMFKLRRAAVEWDKDRLRVLAPFNFTICPAVLVDVEEFGKCWGRWQVEHCPDTRGEKKGMSIVGTTKGKRAPHDLEHCVSLCSGHVEDGRRAGFQWNTANRPAIRQYLAEANQ